MAWEILSLPVLLTGLLAAIYFIFSVEYFRLIIRSILNLTRAQIYRAVRQAYSSSLSAIPNAGILAPLSRLLWAFPQEFSGNITLELPRLHAKYGITVLHPRPCASV